MKKYLFFFLLFFPLFLSADYYQVSVETALNVRDQPGTNSKVLGVLDAGKKVYVEEVNNGWAQINYNDTVGYVSTSFLTKIETPVSEYQSSYVGTYRGPLKAIPIIIVCIAIAVAYLRDWFYLDGVDITFGRIGVLTISILQFLYFGFFKGDLWFCDSDEVGWFWMIVNFILFFFVIFKQVLWFLSLTNEDELHPHPIREEKEPINNWVGYIVYIIAIIILLFVTFPDDRYYWYVFGGLGGILLISSIYSISVAEMHRRLEAFINSLLWFIVPSAILYTLCNSVILLLILIGIWIFGTVFGGKSGKVGTFTDNDGNKYDVY